MANATTTILTAPLLNANNIQPDAYRQVFNITTIAAAGTNQANATAIGLESPFVQVSNNTASNGVLLPTASYIGQEISIFPQLVTAAMLVYPPVGGTINNGSVNASVTTTARKVVKYIAIDRTGINWAACG